MYKIYADKTLIYDSRLEDYVITKGTITKEVNKSGSFNFTIYPDHPYYDRIQKLKTIITVYKGDYIEFRGRVINESIGFYKDKTFTCEGELSFLLDSIQRPFHFQGSPTVLFTKFVNEHNSQVEKEKQFQIGEITVTDKNDYINRSNSNYEDTFKNIMDRLVKTHDGYLHITRGENDTHIINWLADYPYISNQNIEFGENLLNFTKTNKVEDIATAIIPLGAKLEENENDSRLTIESVNNGLDYVYDELAVEKYGWIFKVVVWDDVTIPKNLLTKSKAYLTESINQNVTIELTAIDLSLLDRSINSFRLGDYIPIVSRPHNIDDKFLLKKQTIDLLKPENDKITLGYTYSSFTDKSLVNNNNYDAINTVVTQVNNKKADKTYVDSTLNNYLRKSEIATWAKQPNKPTYSYNEITGKPSSFPPISHNHHELYYTKNEIDDKIQDTGWVRCTFGDGIQAHSDFYPMVRRIGKIVYLKGIVISKTSWKEHPNIITLPDGFAPPQVHSTIQASKNNFRYRLEIHTNGKCSADYITNHEHGNYTVPVEIPEMYFHINTSWLLD